MSTDFMNLNRPGLGNAASYQVSGRPFVTGNLSVPISSSAPLRVDFPTVTKRIIICNDGSHDIKIGFSENGTKGTNYFLLHKRNNGVSKVELEVKATSVFLLSADNITSASLIAELTNIPASEIMNNWSGSAGVG